LLVHIIHVKQIFEWLYSCKIKLIQSD